MKFIYVVFLSFLTPVLIISIAKAESVTISADTITYEDYTLTGQSVSFNNKMGKYGYELSFQRFDTYSFIEQSGPLSIENELDFTNISIGLYRNLNFNKFYIRPIIGLSQLTANLKTTLRYRKEFKALGHILPVDFKYEQHSSKTSLLPMYGVRAGYDFNKYFGVFLGYRNQVYNVKMIGFKVNF